MFLEWILRCVFGVRGSPACFRVTCRLVSRTHVLVVSQ